MTTPALKTAEEVIRASLERFGRPLVLSTSFQKGGVIVLDMAIKLDPALRVVTLDTGRLPEETYAMIESVRDRYGVSVETIFPDAREVERMSAQYGPNLFYSDYASRLVCCQVRKVRPLSRKLTGVAAFMTGLRREQTESRRDLEQVEESSVPVKISPLAYWSTAEVDAYTALHSLPVHPLYSAGYTSIGCAPCTRAAGGIANSRIGRWWWESEDNKECGIHFTPEGQARRTLDVMLEQIVNSKS